MAGWGDGSVSKGLTCKDEDLTLDPRSHMKSWVWYVPSYHRAAEAGMDGHLLARQPGSHTRWALGLRDPVSKSGQCARDGFWSCPLAATHMGKHICMHTHKHAYTPTWTCTHTYTGKHTCTKWNKWVWKRPVRWSLIHYPQGLLGQEKSGLVRTEQDGTLQATRERQRTQPGWDLNLRLRPPELGGNKYVFKVTCL